MSKKNLIAAIAATALVGVPMIAVSAGVLNGGPAEAVVADRSSAAEAVVAPRLAAAEKSTAATAPQAPAAEAPRTEAEAPRTVAPRTQTDTSPSEQPGDTGQDAVEAAPDTTKPVIRDAVFGPVKGVQTFTLGQIEENPARAYVEIQQLVDAKWKKLQGQQFLDANEFPFTVDTDLLASGVRTQLKVSTWDAAGNHTSKTFPVGIDRDRPTTTLVAPTAGAVNTASLEIRLDAADAQGLDRLTANIYADGTLLKSTSSKVGGATTATHTASVPLADGQYVIRYNAVDLAGNVSATREQSVGIDTVAPVIEVKPGTDTVNGIYRTNPSFKLSDAGQGKVDYVLINRVKKDLTDAKWSDLNGQNYTAKQGANVIELFDVAGNSSAFTFEFDSIAPTYTVKDGVVPVNGVYNTKPSLKLADAGNIDYVTINGAKKDLTNAKWSDLNAQNYTGLQGQNVIEIVDTAGNTTVFSFVLDTVAPAVVTIDQIDDPRNGQARTAVTLTFSEPVTGLGQGWYGQGTTFTKVFYNEKEHTVAFTDAAGNAGSFVFTSQAPTVPAS